MDNNLKTLPTYGQYLTESKKEYNELNSYMKKTHPDILTGLETIGYSSKNEKDLYNSMKAIETELTALSDDIPELVWDIKMPDYSTTNTPPIRILIFTSDESIKRIFDKIKKAFSWCEFYIDQDSPWKDNYAWQDSFAIHKAGRKRVKYCTSFGVAPKDGMPYKPLDGVKPINLPEFKKVSYRKENYNKIYQLLQLLNNESDISKKDIIFTEIGMYVNNADKDRHGDWATIQQDAANIKDFLNRTKIPNDQAGIVALVWDLFR